ncbi:hypothetical protein Pint_02305 [Pistacia integerrima]|uniref:Uncharacterized protein n=1 Tax=Pistacia integerrima TaxID=434235 RepID=A0ACC0ZRD3_9ROSI|nr:hypothetical protein Pint_02305 [Pistacia integerrima]
MGRLFFKAKEMVPFVEAPNTVKNSVSFTTLGFLDGEVSFKEVKVGGLEFWYGAKSEMQVDSMNNCRYRLVISKNDEFLSDLGIFLVKEQQKMPKKAMKEEEKVSREAGKIVKWEKQVSMRMSAHDIEDELNDD